MCTYHALSVVIQPLQLAGIGSCRVRLPLPFHPLSRVDLQHGEILHQLVSGSARGLLNPLVAGYPLPLRVSIG